MGAFTLIAGRPTPERERLEGRQSAAMRSQGYVAPERLDFDDGVLFVYPKQVSQTTSIRSFGAGEFIAVCGTFFYRASTGAEGLTQIFRDFSVSDSAEKNFDPLPAPLYGTYICIVRKNGRLYIFSDRLGLYKAYISDTSVISSSFLATVACTTSLRPNAQAIFEYVFQGATYGDETVIENVRLLNPDRGLMISQGRVDQGRRPPLAPPVIERLSLDDHVDRVGHVLDRVFDDCVEAFRGRVDTALSGGYDSRLILAHLLARDVRPNVHVYGMEQDTDVRVAKQIARAEGFHLAHIDKSQYQSARGRDELAEIVDRNFHAFDGIPADGIFDAGADLATRRERAGKGVIALNGGGGEIFRNFFYLPDFPFSAGQLVWTFYSQFDPRAFGAGYQPSEYQQRMREKIEAVLGISGRRLTRGEVERVYPAFRCRYWMGRNSSINNKLGLMHTPLVEPALVEVAGTVPVGQKNGGRLAARLIRRVSKRLANYDSAYGYSFGEDPPFSAVLQEKMTLYRPPIVRQWTFRVKSALRRNDFDQRRATAARFDFLFPGGLSSVAQFLRTEYVVEPAQFNRMRTLEYFFQRLGGS
ncbi:asparagine synthetase B family protein [Lentisalinibacter orientalis]|uniref:hypothetical protein n=1 Tax=Lentisalinibacter orientalis TaxID=2992241 RepID=UPI003869741B